MREAGAIIDEIEAPVGPTVEGIDGQMLVLAALTIKQEALVLLLRRYSARTTACELEKCMDRRNPSSVQRVRRELWRAKLIAGDASGYLLTQTGLSEANTVTVELLGDS
ncbi:MAG: hypothetical protein KOO61_09970 [Spirochaetales bacterium]|nr:hypothetical protein [Spirochaetales bacterium]